MTIFETRDITLHSGQESNFKIECDSLTDDDIETLAMIAAQRSPHFREVVGVPTGGLRFAKALEKYIVPDTKSILIADDVMTTGNSMWEMKKKVAADNPCNSGHLLIQGVVIFSRVRPGMMDFKTIWVKPIFQMWT